MKFDYRGATRRVVPPVVVLLAAGLTAAVHFAGPASAASPALTFVVPTKTQEVQRFKGEPVVLFRLGYFAVASKAVEFRTQRGSSYANPVTTTLSVGEGSQRVTTTLPAGITTTPATLTNFFDVTVTNSAGKVVTHQKLSFCPNSYDQARIAPSGAADSPYPQECGTHPFALGGIFGIPGGWSTPALNNHDDAATFKGKDGDYLLTSTVASPWRSALGLTLAQGTAQVHLKVVTTDDDRKPVAASAESMADMPGMQGMDMPSASDTRLSPQYAALAAARARAQGTPNTPAPHRPSATKLSTAAASDTPEPDLRSLPAYQIHLDTRSKPGRTYLNFGATVWNAGPSPLVVDGFRKKGTNVMDAYQYFFDNAGKQLGYAPAGGMQWDGRKGHNHWHFKAFASYRLLNSTKTKALISGKEAFCLAPTDGIDLTVPGADLKPASTDLYTACGQGDKNLLSIREVLNTGWGDTYSQSLPGQSFDITGVSNGIYYIQTIANPEKKLAESNTANNTALRKVKIGGKIGGRRTIKSYPVQGING